ncbi:MAG: DUF5989 family protein [Candidatus Latescibacterota bacterium]
MGGKLDLAAELWAFMRVRKKWWLGPIFVTFFLLGTLIVMTQGSAVAPFIYALF